MLGNDYEENSEDRRIPEDHEIEKINSSEESLAYGLYSQLLAYEDHYNIIQNRLKALTITWTLATFIAIGYLISGYEKALYIDVLLVILFLCLLAAQGVYFLWLLDASVYESLIFSIWTEIYKQEERFPLLGKSHHIVKKLFKKEGKNTIFHGVFYAYFIFVLLLIGIFSLSIYFFFISKLMIAISIPIIFLVLYLINKKTKKSLLDL